MNALKTAFSMALVFLAAAALAGSAEQFIFRYLAWLFVISLLFITAATSVDTLVTMKDTIRAFLDWWEETIGIGSNDKEE